MQEPCEALRPAIRWP